MVSWRLSRSRQAAQRLFSQLPGALPSPPLPGAAPALRSSPLCHSHSLNTSALPPPLPPLLRLSVAPKPPLPFASATCSSSNRTGCHASSSHGVRRFSSGKTVTEKPAADSPDTDEDFKPQYRKPEELSPIHKVIAEDIRENPVMVYMKGVPSAPMCGFSGGVVQILRAYGVEFKSRNVLEDPELRQGIKTFSQWPTIPQVFVNGEFVGGADILFRMHTDGELEGFFATLKKPEKET